MKDNKPLSVLSANNQINRQFIKLIRWQAVVHSHSLHCLKINNTRYTHSLSSGRCDCENLRVSLRPHTHTHIHRLHVVRSYNSTLGFKVLCACCLCIFHHGTSCTLPEGETGIFFQLFRWVDTLLLLFEINWSSVLNFVNITVGKFV